MFSGTRISFASAISQLELASLPEAVAALASALEGELRRGERDVDAARAGV